ncbi:hypothetical protein P3W45_001262 [Vairimorpha bombi]|jgi:hypothetical protein
MSSSEESQGQFDRLITDLQDIVMSIEILEESESNFKQETEGTTRDQYELIQSLTDSPSLVPIQNIKYDGLKYMFLKNIQDEGKPPVYLFISTDADANGKKRGLFITSFFSYSVIFTFDFKKINATTAKIINVLDQYQPEE